MMVQRNKRRNDALKEGQELYEYACDVKKKFKQNKKYIEQQVERNDLFIVPLNTRAIVSHVNKKYGVPGDEKVLSKTSLLRYHNEGIKERNRIRSSKSPGGTKGGVLGIVNIHQYRNNVHHVRCNFEGAENTTGKRESSTSRKGTEEIDSRD